MQNGSDPPAELSEVAMGFLTFLAVTRGRSKATLESYRSDLLAFEAWLSSYEVELESVGRSDVERYLSSHLRNHDPHSTRRSLSAVRGLFKFMVTHNVIEVDPTLLVRPPKVAQRLPKALTTDSVDALLASVNGRSPLELRDRLMLEILYGSALRISELVSLRVSSMGIEDGLLQVTGKGSKQRLVPVSKQALVALSEYLESGRGQLLKSSKRGDISKGILLLNASGGPLSRQGAWLVLKARASALGMGSDFSPHTLRHSCATHMVDNGADLRVVQELLGHVDLATTQIYTRVSLSRILSVHNQFHPRSKTNTDKVG